MLGQLEERAGRPDAARAAYANGLKRCPDCVPLWRAAAALEEKCSAVAKARALLEQARLRNPKTDALWLAAVRTEQRAGNAKAADALLAKVRRAAVKHIPNIQLGVCWVVHTDTLVGSGGLDKRLWQAARRVGRHCRRALASGWFGVLRTAYYRTHHR